MDYALNQQRDIHFTEWGDFATVTGRSEFEQAVVIALESEEGGLLGDTTRHSNVKEKARLATIRTAKQFEEINNIQDIDVSLPEPGTLAVSVTYLTGETFTETL